MSVGGGWHRLGRWAPRRVMGLRGNRQVVQALILCTNFFGALSGGVLGLCVTPIAHDFGVDIRAANVVDTQ